MDVVAVLLALAVMLVGLVGVLVPVLPGLLLVWVAGVVTLLWQGPDLVGWLAVGVLTLLFAAGTAATLVLPTRTGRQGGVDGRTLGLVALGAGAGLVVIPVVGLLVGALAGLYLGERLRLEAHDAAWRSTLRVLRAYGVGVLVELLLGVTMIAVWATVLLVRW